MRIKDKHRTAGMRPSVYQMQTVWKVFKKTCLNGALKDAGRNRQWQHSKSLCAVRLLIAVHAEGYVAQLALKQLWHNGAFSGAVPIVFLPWLSYWTVHLVLCNLVNNHIRTKTHSVMLSVGLYYWEEQAMWWCRCAGVSAPFSGRRVAC